MIGTCPACDFPVTVCCCDDVDAPSLPAGFTPGGSFILDASPVPEPVWGNGSFVLWSKGEPLIVTGGIGAGKTTLTGQLLRASVGLQTEVAGFDVTECGRVLYLAADRPKQIARNLRRIFGEQDRGLLDERLVVVPGPPVRDLASDTRLLLDLAKDAGLGEGDRVMLDSAKDYALDLSANEVGAAWNQAVQRVVAEGIDFAANHHQRKAASGAAKDKPKSLADLYGSTWIGAGAGTVVLLWPSEPGSPVVELSTLKAAADDVGPVELLHDIDAGTFTVVEQVTVEGYLVAARHTCHSLRDIAKGVGAKDDRAGIEKTRRRVQRLVDAGRVKVIEHRRPDSGGSPQAFFQWIEGRP